ncbi:MAG: biotin/lipoyl-containing protein, partial [Streptosporangiaceae bacterium]
MIREFRLPDAGEGLTEADIVTWHVKPGDQVKVNQVIVEIETAKAVVELPSPFDGTVSRLLVNEGQTVDVGAPIIAIDVTGADGEASEAVRANEERAVADRAAAAAATDTSGAQSVLVGYGVRESSTTRRRRVGTPAASAPVAPPPPAAPAVPAAAAGAPANGRSMSHRPDSMPVNVTSTGT